MTRHVFVDESKQRGYLLAAAAVAPGHLRAARKAITDLIMPGQRRIHFATESDGRRKLVLDALVALSPAVVVYDASSIRSRDARPHCLRALVADAAAAGDHMLVLELDDSVRTLDRKVLYQHISDSGCGQTLRYRHLRTHEEPLLTIPDAVAWCWQRGGEWRKRADELVVRKQVL